MSKPFQSIGVIGAGAWGTALAVTAHRAGADVRVWAFEPELAQSLSAGHGNPLYLPMVELPPLACSTDMASLACCDAILAVAPAQHMRATLRQWANEGAGHLPVALCAKGVEAQSLKLMGEVLADELPHAPRAVLSGPSFAIDVARGLPTAVTLAAADASLGQAFIQALGRAHFRPYYSDDLIGAEVGGAVKNVLAIACGVVEGLDLGRSAHAALIARGFAEMTRLGVALGGRAETLAGLCGLGDLVLTCSSPQSRNMSFGMALGQGQAAADVLASRRAVTEGVASAPGVVALAKRAGVEMPICSTVAALCAGEMTVEAALGALLNRPFKAER
jgi:glycerol-3-phosphate dehydrogenase (NAD(P)+)